MTPILSPEQALARLLAEPPPHTYGYLAMYSSLWDAIVTDPRFMGIPVDDHLVHRGDGVFETLLFEAGRAYNLGAHLDRLFHSGERIGLACPLTREKLETVIHDLFQSAGAPRALARILMGRGPGGFSVDPSESPVSTLYAVVYPASPPFMETHPGGARMIYSRIPPKAGDLAILKTCNYLPNVLMKAEANSRGAHFVLGIDEEGYVTESFTENIAGVDGAGTLVVPPPVRHLPGTTLKRVAELAAAAGIPVREQRLTPGELEAMSEILVVGTTACVTSVTDLEGREYPLGPVAASLSSLLLKDIRGGAEPAPRVSPQKRG